jgi:putative flippase GtrA
MLLNQQFIRFILVGGLNTIFGYSLFAFFIYLGLVYPVAVLFSTILGVLFNYKTIGKIVFSSTKNKLMPFIFVYGFIYSLNVFFLWLFSILGLENMYISGAIILAPLAVFSYLMNKNFVFN